MNLFVLGWFWRGLKGHSVTFSALFASVVLGVSLAGGAGRLLATLGVHWLYVLLLPGLGFAWLNRKEPEWLPEMGRRRRIARGLLFGSLAVALALRWAGVGLRA